MTIIKEFPVLFARNKNNSIQQWSVRVLGQDDGKIVVRTIHGQKDGKMQCDDRIIEKLNRRHSDLIDQAIHFAESRWDHKRNRERYAIDIQETSRTIAPMLSKTFEGGKHLVFPLYVQPKIDGLRCLARWVEGAVELRSRTGFLFRSSHLSPIRERLVAYLGKYPDHVLDGELYSRDMSFEELSGLCRLSDKTGPIRTVRYYIFDVIILDEPNAGFQSRMSHMTLPDDEILQILPTHQCHTLDEVMAHHGEFLVAGHEGTMMRNRDGIYRMGYRSWDLQKYKNFMEEEFEIVGFDEGAGRDSGTVIWRCVTSHGKAFRVRPRGTLAHRSELFQNAAKYIGDRLTVIFQEYSADGIPRFPVGKAVRRHY